MPSSESWSCWFIMSSRFFQPMYSLCGSTDWDRAER